METHQWKHELISAQESFWCRGNKAFFDIRIFDPNTQRHENKTLTICYELHEHEKKRDYSSRILNVEQGSFTPLVFSITGGMGRECSMFVKQLFRIISLKRKEELSVATYGIRCKISDALLRSSLLCVQGSCKMSSKYAEQSEHRWTQWHLVPSTWSKITKVW